MPTEKEIETLVMAVRSILLIPHDKWSEGMLGDRAYLIEAVAPFTPIELEVGQVWVRPGLVDKGRFHSCRIRAIYRDTVFIEGVYSDGITDFALDTKCFKEKLLSANWELKESANDQRTADTASF